MILCGLNKKKGFFHFLFFNVYFHGLIVDIIIVIVVFMITFVIIMTQWLVGS